MATSCVNEASEIQFLSQKWFIKIRLAYKDPGGAIPLLTTSTGHVTCTREHTCIHIPIHIHNDAHIMIPGYA